MMKPNLWLFAFFLLVLTVSCKKEFICDNTDHFTEEIKPEKPTVVHIGMVSPGILGITFQEKYVKPCIFKKYENQAGDTVIYHTNKSGVLHARVLQRDGKKVGWLAGENEDMICYFEEIKGDSINQKYLGAKETYSISSASDHHYNNALLPEKVDRKSKIQTWSYPEKDLVMSHTVYLHLPHKLKHQRNYMISFNHLNLDTDSITYCHYPKHTRSEAVHVTQVGFRADDPVKKAYLSIWLGTGGAHSYNSLPEFVVFNEENIAVYTGKGIKALSADSVETIKETKNYSKTEVWHLDFSDVQDTGTYRVFVKNIGCSFPFQIHSNPYNVAFKTTMKGFLFHRSGIALDSKYGSYIRPRCFHPDDGVKIVKSEFSMIDNWLDYGGQGGVFKGLLENKTAEAVKSAWGGYMDAGDWDRRIQHLWATRQLLELYELFPEYFKELDLVIPENENEIPDVLDEALWNIDCYKRMQESDGGIPYGIESAAHPVNGETSWYESLTVMRFKPDMWSSYIFAGTAAKVADILTGINASLAGEYEQSAVSAMEYAEKERVLMKNSSEWKRLSNGRKRMINDERCLAAIELYKLTGHPTWHKIFLSTSALENYSKNTCEDVSLTQLDASFSYLLLQDSLSEEKTKTKAMKCIINRANKCVDQVYANAYNLTNRNTAMPLLNGYYSAINNQELCRAHYLTDSSAYLKGAILSAQFTAGANPMNLVYTTGLGKYHVRRPLHIDSRNTGQHAPEGITVYGQSDYEFFIDGQIPRDPDDLKNQWALWAVYWFAGRYNTPSGWKWPPHEGYYDYSGFPSYNEYTIMQTFGPVSYGYGYLSARK